MASAHIIVDVIRRVELPTSPLAQVRGLPADRAVIDLQGAACLLDMSKPQAVLWAALLDDLRTEQAPVYLAVDPATNIIQDILLPRVLYVTKVAPQPVGDQQPVELEISCARHFIRPSNPNYSQLLNALLAAQTLRSPILITETLNEHEIIDARPIPAPFAHGAAAMMTKPPPPPNVHLGGRPPYPAAGPVTPLLALQLFNLLAGAGNIPFLFPDDGCYARAHEMCRLILANGFVPHKLWIYGNLTVSTRNHPLCNVSWHYHVAPALQVDPGSGVQTEVIDPALFPAPVPQAAWTAAQQDPNAQIYDTDASVFLRDITGQLTYDLNYRMTHSALRYFGRQLLIRTAQNGPPPYAHCP